MRSISSPTHPQLSPLLKNEPFSHSILADSSSSTISAVNCSEVLSKLHDDGLTDAQRMRRSSTMDLRVIAFDGPQARVAARLRPVTRHAGLSLGDRACLALGLELGRSVVTADRAWANLDIGVDIVLIR